MNFRVGQKVVFVDDSCRPGFAWVNNDHPQVGGIYTVAQSYIGVDLLLGEVACITLVEHKRHPIAVALGNEGFKAARFRPLVEKKTDISIFTEMLNPSQVDA